MAAILVSRAFPKVSASRTCIFCETKAVQRSVRRAEKPGRVSRRKLPGHNGFIIRPISASFFSTTPRSESLIPLVQTARHFTSPSRLFRPPTERAPPSKNPSLQPSPSDIVQPTRPKRPHVRARDGELVPSPLSRPLGLPHPPQPGENTGIDARGWQQRRDDFVSYEKHLERRRGLIKDLYEKNYFRDMGNLGKVHKGKSILSPTTPFRKEVALWFPNLRGRTLVRGVTGDTEDTTPVLRGRVSVVCVLNSQWGEEQTKTFVGEKEGQNPELARFLRNQGADETAQMVWINVEENWLKWGLIRMFFGRLRRMMPESEWGKYFLVRRGLSDEIRDAMGIWNMKVGYVYLVDGMCKVRWAGNGNARDDEKVSLLNSLQRLVDEARGVSRAKVTRQDPRQPRQITPSEKQAASVGSS